MSVQLGYLLTTKVRKEYEIVVEEEMTTICNWFSPNELRKGQQM